MILVGIIIVVVNFDLLCTYLLRGQTIEQFRSGTGRIDIWNTALPYIENRPVVGYGFGAGGEIVAKNLFGLATMHSAIYETLLGIGVIGLCSLCIQYFYVAIRVINNVLKYGFNNNLMDLFLLLYFLIRSLTSVGIGNWHSQEIMIWYYFMFAVSGSESIQLTYKNMNYEVEHHGRPEQ